MRTSLLILFLALAAVPAASAQPSQQPFFNVVTIEASATADVPTDTLTVTLFVEEQGPDPAALATRVNARLEEALARAKREPKVEAHSGNYQTTPVYDRAEPDHRLAHPRRCRARKPRLQGCLRRSPAPAAGAQAGVDDVLALRAAREAADAALLTEALGKFQERARAVAKGLGFPGYQLGQIVVRNEGPIRPPPIAYRQHGDVGDGRRRRGPVPVEGGKNAVTVFVSGSIVLGPGSDVPHTAAVGPWADKRAQGLHDCDQ